MPKATIHDKATRVAGRVRGFLGEVSTRDVRRLFDRDAAEAYAVLTRGHASAPAPAGRLRRFFFHLKLLFLGMSAKLTPPRRLLFVTSLIAAGLGFFKITAKTSTGSVSIDLSGFWFSIAIAGLVFLLALELVDRIRVRDELEVARALQKELLPRSVPAIAGYEIAHSYRTANEVGGDYYDFLPLPDGRIAVVIGDASGHGMASGLLMAIANATLKLAIELDPAPAKVIELLNRVMCRTGDRRSFMTLFYGVLAPASGRLEYACAGHPFPILRQADGTLAELGAGGLPLGIRDALPVASESLVMAPGELLVLYSDGLPEAINRAGEAFGYERLLALASPGGSPQAVHDRMLAAFSSFLGDEPLRDDACLVVLGRG